MKKRREREIYRLNAKLQTFLSDPRDLNLLIYLIILIFTFFDGKDFMF